jgi:hypothetical protein
VVEIAESDRPASTLAAIRIHMCISLALTR